MQPINEKVAKFTTLAAYCQEKKQWARTQAQHSFNSMSRYIQSYNSEYTSTGIVALP